MGRVSRGPPLRAIATIGGGGRSPARKRILWTGSEGCAPTDNQYLNEQRKEIREISLKKDALLL